MTMKTKNTDRLSAWRFVKYALLFKPCKTPIYNYVLIRLADYADTTGFCFPSRPELMKTIGCGERTLEVALAYWRKLGAIRWERGWGNQHGNQSNRYWFKEAVIQQLLESEASEDDETANSAVSSPAGESTNSAEVLANLAEVSANPAELSAKSNGAFRNGCALTSHRTSQENVSIERPNTTSDGKVAAVVSQNRLNDLSLVRAKENTEDCSENRKDDLNEQRILGGIVEILRGNFLSTKISSAQKTELLKLADEFGEGVMCFALDRWLDEFDDVEQELGTVTDGRTGKTVRREYVLGEFIDGVGYAICSKILPFYERGARMILEGKIDECLQVEDTTAELETFLMADHRYMFQDRCWIAIEKARDLYPSQPLHDSLPLVWDDPEIVASAERWRVNR